MRNFYALASLVTTLALTGPTIAAPAVSAAATKPETKSSAVADDDCRKLGSEINGLIDKRTESPNISRVRALFQDGIMACMEGDTLLANQHYREARNLLVGNEQRAAISPPKK